MSCQKNNAEKISLNITHIKSDTIIPNDIVVSNNNITSVTETNNPTHNKKKKKKSKIKIYKNKCNCLMEGGTVCKKKLKNTEIITNKCKCGLVFCSKHKSIYAHNCTYDYSQDMKKQGLGGGIAKKVLSI